MQRRGITLSGFELPLSHCSPLAEPEVGGREDVGLMPPITLLLLLLLRLRLRLLRLRLLRPLRRRPLWLSAP